MSAGNQRDVSGFALKSALQPEMIVLVECGDHNVSPGAEGDLFYVKVLVDDVIGVGEAIALGGGIVDGNGEAEQMSEAGEGFGDASMASDYQLRLRDDRFDVDVHHSSTWHADAQNFILHVQGDQGWLFRLDAFDGFTADSAFRATSAYPAEDDFAVLIDQGLGATLCRG